MITNAIENLRMALDGLTANKMRSSLTMLGVIIGVGAVIALMSVGEGAQASITQEISSVGTNLIFVAPGNMRMGPVRGATGANLTYDDAKAIADPDNVPDAAAVAPEYSRSAQVIFGDTNTNISVLGTVGEYLDGYFLEVASGRFIEQKDVDKRATVAVLGYQAARDLFGDYDPIGQKIKVALSGENGGRVSLTVVGTLAEKGGSMRGGADDTAFVPISTAQTKLFSGRSVRGDLLVTSITVVAASEDQTDAVVDQIDTLLQRRHSIGPEEELDYTLMSQDDMLQMMTTVTDTLTIFLGAVAGISLLVGGIGIMNIMLVSVTERTREIGIRKAVGARRSDILVQFLLEAVVLSLVGGVVGIMLGIGLGKLVELTGMVDSLVTPDSVALAVGFSLAVGLFFGIYPANQAAKLNPIEALRYE